MSRRRKSSPLGDFVSLLALLPWWVSLLLAVISYFVLHVLATSKPQVVTQTSQFGTAVVHSVYVGFAILAQYLIPILCVAAAGVSFFKAKRRTDLIKDVASSKATDVLDHMSWQDFERLVGKAFELDGYRVAETGGGGADGGVDLVLRRGDEKFLVQCKQWKAYKVGVEVVRDLYGVMAARGATGGFVVTSGIYTDDAQAFAQGRNVKLLDGVKLRQMIARANRGKSAVPYSAPVSSPACPVCGSRMEIRTAKRGPNAGSKFWGCTKYPKCKGTINI